MRRSYHRLNVASALALGSVQAWVWRVSLLLLTLAIAATRAYAEGTGTDEEDPADRVARISYLDGDVSVRRDATETTAGDKDDDTWSNAALNLPLTDGDALRTDNNSRAELQLGGIAVQVDEESQLQWLVLNDDRVQLQLNQGAVIFSVRRDDRIEVVTPNARISLREPGTYRINVWDEETQLQVTRGRAEVSTSRQHFTVRNNEQLVLEGTQRLSVQYDDLPRADSFDRWAADRNGRSARSVSSRYVSDDVIGYEDLDDHGDWRNEPEYGYVWYPTRVTVGWAPYREGRWVWVAPWGWTWIDDAPWGFAPFHYGRWAQVRDRWCWVPGPRAVRPIYAPALVAWVDTPNISVSVSVGSRVGWVPLGPRDVYRPWYRSSPHYWTRLNVSSSRLNEAEIQSRYTRPEHDYANRVATTFVNGDVFHRGQPIRNNIVNVDLGRIAPRAEPPMFNRDRDSRGWRHEGRDNDRPASPRAQPDQVVTPTLQPRSPFHPMSPPRNADDTSVAGPRNNPPAIGGPTWRRFNTPMNGPMNGPANEPRVTPEPRATPQLPPPITPPATPRESPNESPRDNVPRWSPRGSFGAPDENRGRGYQRGPDNDRGADRGWTGRPMMPDVPQPRTWQPPPPQNAPAPRNQNEDEQRGRGAFGRPQMIK